LANKTKIQVEVEAIATGFGAITKELEKVFANLGKVKVGPELIADFNKIKLAVDSLGDSFNTLITKANSLNTTSKNPFSQVFSTKDIEKFKQELASLQTQLKAVYGKTVSPSPQRPMGPTTTVGEKNFQQFIQKQKENIGLAKQQKVAAEAWIAANKKIADPAIINSTKEYIHTQDRVIAGLKEGRLSIRNFALSMGILKTQIKDLIFWQAQWYATKFLIFTPLQIGADVIRGFVAWQQSMQNAAAVSNYTQKEMEELKQTTLDIGRTTPIAAKAAASALLEFAQAGLSAATAQKLLPLASKMVIATQEDMKTAVSALTTAFYAWKLEAKDMPAVADQIAAAMADSKLKVEDLGTIFNYLGTMAKQAGLSVSETLTLVTVMSKAGVKPSTIGTGLTQAMVALTKMAPKLKAEFTKLKLDWREFQLPQNNPLEVFKKMADAGINLTAIFKGFETRAGRSVAAVVNQGLQMIEETEAKIKEKGFLDKAFETSMDAIENQAKRFKGIMESDIYAILDTSGTVVAKFLKTINDGLTGENGLIHVVRFVMGTATALVIIQLGKWIVSFAKVKAIIEAIKLLFTGAGFTAAISNPWVLAAVAVGALITVLLKLKDIFNDVKKSMGESTSEETLRSLSPFAIKQRYKMVGDLVERMEKTTAAGLPTDVQPGELSAVGVPGDLLLKGQTKALAALKKYQRDMWSQVWRISEKGPLNPPDVPTKTTSEDEDKVKDTWSKSLSNLNKAYSEKIKIIQEGEKQAQDILTASHRLQEISDIDFYAESLTIAEEANKKERDTLLQQREALKATYEKEAARAKPEKLQSMWEEYENKREEIGRRLLQIDTDNQKKRLDTHTNTILKLRELETKRLDFEATVAKTIYNREKEVADFRIDEEKKVREYLYGKKDFDPQKYYQDEMSYIKATYELEYALAEKEFNNWKERNYQKYELARQSPDNPNLLVEYNREEEIEYQARLERERKASQKFYSDTVEYARKASDDIRKIFSQGGGLFGGSLAVAQKTLRDLSKNTLDMAQNVSDAVTNISSTMESSFMDFFDHTSEGFLDWQKLITSILNDIVKELIRVYIVKQLIGGLQGFLGGGSTSGNAGMKWDPTAWGGNFGGSFAGGGRVSLNKAYIVGERGPELFNPDSNGTIIPNGGFGGSPTINIYNNNGSKVSTKTNSDNGKLEIDVMIDQLVAGKISKFGSASNKAMRQNFSASQRLTAR